LSLRWEDMAEEESSRIERLRLGCLEVRWEAVSWVRRRAEEDSMAWVGVSRYRLDISLLELLTVRFTYLE
jgi:hypothetical protein